MGPVDAVVCIVDACNLQRHLYLVSQVLELGSAHGRGGEHARRCRRPAASRWTCARLAERLGVPVVAIQANRGVGLAELKAALAEALARAAQPARRFRSVRGEVVGSRQLAANAVPARPADRPLAGDGHFGSAAGQRRLEPEQPELSPLRLPCRCLCGGCCWIPAAICNRCCCRTTTAGWAGSWTPPAAGWPRPAAPCRPSRPRPATPGPDPVLARGRQASRADYRLTASDRIDRLLTHRLWGTLIFALVMLVMFQAVFVWARPLMKGDRGRPRPRRAAGSRRPCAEGALRSLLVDGVIGGVGSVLAFLPQILCSSSSSPCWKIAATWPGPPTSWTASWPASG